MKTPPVVFLVLAAAVDCRAALAADADAFPRPAPAADAHERDLKGGKGGGSGGSSGGGNRGGSGSAGRPASSPVSAPYGARGNIETPRGSIPATAKSPYNPMPSFKPATASGAPTLRSGGGGYSTSAKVLAGTAVAGAATVAAGTFLYGGRHSSPQCRGDDADRFLSGRCPVGASSRAHQCQTDIPL